MEPRAVLQGEEPALAGPPEESPLFEDAPLHGAYSESNAWIAPIGSALTRGTPWLARRILGNTLAQIGPATFLCEDPLNVSPV